MKISRALIALSAVLLAGCADGRSQVGRIVAQNATAGQLPVCHGYGCKVRTVVSLSDAEWASVAALFSPAAADAAAEREQVALAVGRIERLVGPKAGTARDKGENSLTFATGGELDCVDEAANTTTYLRLLAANGLLRWHEVATPAARGRFFDGWPHNTAVLAESKDGARFAIDSWFFDNGRPAAVVPLQQGLKGWRPTAADVERADMLAAVDAASGGPPLQ
jgi:hypothetical protein